MNCKNNNFSKIISCVCLLALIVLMSQPVTSQTFKPSFDVKVDDRQRGDVDLINPTIPAYDFGFGGKRQPQRIASPELAGTDQGLESEPNGTFGTADPLTGSDGRISGNLFLGGPGATAGSDTDFYSFTTTVANSKIYAAIQNAQSNGNTDTILAVIASDGTTVLETDNNDGSLGGSASSIAGTTLAAIGTYYLRVTNNVPASPINSYDLYFAVRNPATLVAETEPNNNGAPQVIPASQYVSGVILTDADTDAFSFSANAGDKIFLSMDEDPERDVTTWNGFIGAGVFGTPGNFTIINDAGTGDTIDSEAYFMTVKTTGTFQVIIGTQTAGQGSATSTYNFNLTIIPAQPSGTCTTYTNAVSTPLADAALTTSTISIPDSKIIRSLRVVTDITHPNFPDLDVHLRSPLNNDNGLFTDVGLAAQTGAQNLRLEDEAAVPLVFNVLNGAIFRPETPYRMDYFKGENTLGTWALDIRDDLATNAGTLNSWSLEVCEEAAPVGTLIYNETFEANNGGYTSGGTANEWEYGTPATVATATIAPFNSCGGGSVSCWKTDLDNTYELSSSQDLTSPVLNLTNYPGTIRLSWDQRFQMESSAFDQIYVQVTNVANPADFRRVWFNSNSTMTDTVGTAATGIPASAGWGVYSADISDFSGKRVQVTFHLESDNLVNLGGWAIDNVQLRHVGVVAANASVGGRITNSGGAGISKVKVLLVNPTGEAVSAITNPFGYYRFDSVPVGQNYIIDPQKKGYSFTSQVVFVTEDMNVNFSPNP